MSVWNDVRNGADCPAVDEYRQELHEEAVATGQQTAEAEEPRGAEEHERGRDQGEEEETEAPPVQAGLPGDVRQLRYLRLVERPVRGCCGSGAPPGAPLAEPAGADRDDSVAKLDHLCRR